MACIIWLMSIINICRIWLVLSANVDNNKYMQSIWLALLSGINVDNKYMQNMACIIWLMSIISNAVYGLYYLANVDNKYMQNMACIIWLMSIINICRIWLVLSG